MDPIINPMYIYLIERLDSIKALFHIVNVISAISTLIFLFLLCITDNDSDFKPGHESPNNIKSTMQKTYTDFLDTCKYKRNNILNLDEKNNNKSIQYIQYNISELNTRTKELANRLEWAIDNMNKWYKKHVTYKKYMLISLSIFTVSIIIQVLIPNTLTGYKLFFLTYITPDNLQLGINEGKDAIKWLLDTITNTINTLNLNKE